MFTTLQPSSESGEACGSEEAQKALDCDDKQAQLQCVEPPSNSVSIVNSYGKWWFQYRWPEMNVYEANALACKEVLSFFTELWIILMVCYFVYVSDVFCLHHDSKCRSLFISSLFAL